MPLLRTPLVASALVIGSMAPDTPMFGLSPVSYATTHSGFGVVTADLALGLAFYVVWHSVVVPPVLALAPRAVRARVPRPERRLAGVSVSSVRWLALVAVSVVVGAATHVGWDEFTHGGRWGTRHLGVLTESFHGVEGYQLAQYASGLLGAAVIIGYLARWWRRTMPKPVPATANVVVSIGCALLVLVVTAAAATVAATPFLTGPGDANIHAGAYAAATHGGAAAAVAVLVVALGWHLEHARGAAAARHR